MTEPTRRIRPNWYQQCGGITDHDLTIKEQRFFFRVRHHLVCRRAGCDYELRDPKTTPYFIKQRVWLEDEVWSPIRCWLKAYLPPVHWAITRWHYLAPAVAVVLVLLILLLTVHFVSIWLLYPGSVFLVNP